MSFHKKQYVTYLAFAAISITLNMGVQIITEVFLKNILSNFSQMTFVIMNKVIELWFLIALMMGTIAGFIFKFIVDKWIVFQDTLTEHESVEKTTLQLVKYFGFAILTTMIFWGTEGAFYVFLGEQWYVLGGILGLIVGYTVKFFLDSKFVFVPSTN